MKNITDSEQKKKSRLFDSLYDTEITKSVTAVCAVLAIATMSISDDIMSDTHTHTHVGHPHYAKMESPSVTSTSCGPSQTLAFTKQGSQS